MKHLKSFSETMRSISAKHIACNSETRRVNASQCSTNESSSINLRTMTMKSKLGSGKYPNYTIEKMLTHDSLKEYLAHNYLNYDKINFTNDVLTSIFGDKLEYFKIPKPGKNPELYKEYLQVKHQLNVQTVSVDADDYDSGTMQSIIDLEEEGKNVEDQSKEIEDQNQNKENKEKFDKSIKALSLDDLRKEDTDFKQHKLLASFKSVIKRFIISLKINTDELFNLFNKLKGETMQSNDNEPIFDQKMLLHCIIILWLKKKKIEVNDFYVKVINIFVSNMINDTSDWAVVGFSKINHKNKRPFVSKNLLYVTYDKDDKKNPFKIQGLISKEDFNSHAIFSKYDNKLLIKKEHIKKFNIEYDFSKGIRGKYSKSFAQGTT